MEASVTLSKTEYDELVTKAHLFEQYMETEELSPEELERIERALEGPFLTKSEFLKKHPELA